MLYRLTGDRHPVHVDPVVSGAMGFERPILHGLATVGLTARAVAGSLGAHPAELRSLDARMAGPVTPGQELVVSAGPHGSGVVSFEVSVSGEPALAGTAGFG